MADNAQRRRNSSVATAANTSRSSIKSKSKGSSRSPHPSRPRKKAREERRITVITGSRAEYGLLVSTMHSLREYPNVRLHIVAAGMHLLKKFGRTVDQIRADGWTISAEVPMQRGNDQPDDQAYGLSRGIRGIAEHLLRTKTDLVVVLGDRIEALAGALAGVLTGCIVTHIHGGDIAPGDFDDTLRHCISKLAHVHFPATKSSARRLERMGESRRRIFIVGAPGLDRLRELLDSAPRARRAAGRALVMQHATGRPPEEERATAAMILGEVARWGLRRTIIFPNSDRGHIGVLAAIEEHIARSPRDEVKVVRSLPRDEYLRLLLASDLLIGNSSSGVIEAPFAGVPVVNVGPRQGERERGGPGIVDADEIPASIHRAIKVALKAPRKILSRTPYGDGFAGERIALQLATLPLASLRSPKPAP